MDNKDINSGAPRRGRFPWLPCCGCTVGTLALAAAFLIVMGPIAGGLRPPSIDRAEYRDGQVFMALHAEPESILLVVSDKRLHREQTTRKVQISMPDEQILLIEDREVAIVWQSKFLGTWKQGNEHYDTTDAGGPEYVVSEVTTKTLRPSDLARLQDGIAYVVITYEDDSALYRKIDRDSR